VCYRRTNFLHQIARDGFDHISAVRVIFIEEIFDVNALDLAKVGKDFGSRFLRGVNVNLGDGKSTGMIRGRKRVVW